MLPDDIEDIDPELQHRLSSWRHVSGVVEQSLEHVSEAGVNEAEVRTRQRHIANMCLNTVKAHDAFVADLKAFVEKPGRDPHHQQRVEDEAAFALGVFEQASALTLQKGIENEAADLPREVVETVYVPAPQPPKSWFQRFLGS
jgi:hypothetical protein